jgi:hypothetical protein
MEKLSVGESAFVATGIAYSIYLVVLQKWNWYYRKEMEEVSSNAVQFLSEGYIKLENNDINYEKKKKTFMDNLFPLLVEHWTKVFPGFDLNNPFTWPRPKNGRAYDGSLVPSTDKSSQQYRMHEKFANNNLLFTSNYRLQAMLAFLFDKKMNLVTFREKTHWKMIFLYPTKKALITLTNKIIYLFTKSYDPFHWEATRYLPIFGDDSAWHLTNWPNPINGKAGQPLENNAHIDSGYQNIYSQGIPLSAHDNLQINQIWKNRFAAKKSSPITLEDIKLMIMILRMISVQLSIDTPAERVEISQGTTGAYQQSHIPILLAMKQFLLSSSSSYSSSLLLSSKKRRSTSCCSQTLHDDDEEDEQEEEEQEDENEKDFVDSGKQTLTPPFLRSGSRAISFSTDESMMISFQGFNETIKKYGTKLSTGSSQNNNNKNNNKNNKSNINKSRLFQSSFNYNESLVIFGLTAHTTMWATEAITLIQQNSNKTENQLSLPRTIENCKIHIHSEFIHHLEKLLEFIVGKIVFEDSLLLQFIHDPMGFLERRTGGEKGQPLSHQFLVSESKELVEEFLYLQK